MLPGLSVTCPVYIKIKNLTDFESETSRDVINWRTNKELSIDDPKLLRSLRRTFRFDKIFSKNCSHLDTWKSLASQFIKEVIVGYSHTVFDISSENNSAEILPFVLSELSSCSQRTIRISAIHQSDRELKDLINEDEVDDYNLLKNPTEITITRQKDINLILETLKDHLRGPCHSIYTITVITPREANTTDVGTLILAFLYNESGNLNTETALGSNLSVFEDVLNSLCEKATYVPYKDSRLTKYLRDSLVGNHKNSFIFSISPAASCLEGTIRLMCFARKIRSITHVITPNKTRDTEKFFNAELSRLKEEWGKLIENPTIVIDSQVHEALSNELIIRVTTTMDLKMEVEDRERIVREYDEVIRRQIRTIEDTEERINREWEDIDQLKRAALDLRDRVVHKQDEEERQKHIYERRQEILTRLRNIEVSMREELAHIKEIRDNLHLVRLGYSEIDLRNEKTQRNFVSAAEQHTNNIISAVDDFFGKMSTLTDRVRSLYEYNNVLETEKMSLAKIISHFSDSLISEVDQSVCLAKTEINEKVRTLREYNDNLLDAERRSINKQVAVKSAQISELSAFVGKSLDTEELRNSIGSLACDIKANGDAYNEAMKSLSAGFAKKLRIPDYSERENCLACVAESVSGFKNKISEITNEHDRRHIFDDHVYHQYDFVGFKASVSWIPYWSEFRRVVGKIDQVIRDVISNNNYKAFVAVVDDFLSATRKVGSERLAYCVTLESLLQYYEGEFDKVWKKWENDVNMPLRVHTRVLLQTKRECFDFLVDSSIELMEKYKEEGTELEKRRCDYVMRFNDLVESLNDDFGRIFDKLEAMSGDINPMGYSPSGATPGRFNVESTVLPSPFNPYLSDDLRSDESMNISLLNVDNDDN